MGKKTAFSILTLLREAGYSEKAIQAILRYYGHSKKRVDIQHPA